MVGVDGDILSRGSMNIVVRSATSEPYHSLTHEKGGSHPFYTDTCCVFLDKSPLNMQMYLEYGNQRD